MERPESLMTERDQRFQELEELLTGGGARDEGKSNSGWENQDGVQTGGSVPALGEVEATGDFAAIFEPDCWLLSCRGPVFTPDVTLYKILWKVSHLHDTEGWQAPTVMDSILVFSAEVGLALVHCTTSGQSLFQLRSIAIIV